MPHSPAHSDTPDQIRAFLVDQTPGLLDRLSAWVSIPSVAADPSRSQDVIRSAHWLAGEMRDVGMTTQVWPTGDTCAVYGESIVDPEAPTVLVYSHHDVRHAKPEEWQETEPFTPVHRDGRLYGRGASDAKGQALAHVWAVRALDALGHRDRVNVRMLVEGEEEIGSPHLQNLLRAHADDLACDLVVFSDTVQWKADAPAVVTSMRGTVNASLTIRGPARDVHSGVAAGVTVNPATVLAEVIGRLHDEHGRIAVRGFYDDVAELSAQRRQEFDALPVDRDEWVRRTETREIVGEDGFSLVERLWARPSIEVLSLLAGDPQGIQRSVIPREASASFSIRTVPDQRIPTISDQLRAFVAELMPVGAEYTFEIDEPLGQEPYVSPGGAVLAALERALERGYGTPVRGRMGNAGGGPADLLSIELGAPVHFLGTGLPEDHWHSSDESVDVGMLVSGAATIAHLWLELRALPRQQRRARGRLRPSADES